MPRHRRIAWLLGLALVAADARAGEVRGRVVAAFEAMGLRAIPSSANFLMVDLKRPVQPIRDALHARKIDVGRSFPVMPTYLRVTVGTAEQMDRFLAAFNLHERADRRFVDRDRRVLDGVFLAIFFVAEPDVKPQLLEDALDDLAVADHRHPGPATPTPDHDLRHDQYGSARDGIEAEGCKRHGAGARQAH